MNPPVAKFRNTPQPSELAGEPAITGVSNVSDGSITDLTRNGTESGVMPELCRAAPSNSTRIKPRLALAKYNLTSSQTQAHPQARRGEIFKIGENFFDFSDAPRRCMLPCGLIANVSGRARTGFTRQDLRPFPTGHNLLLLAHEQTTERQTGAVLRVHRQRHERY